MTSTPKTPPPTLPPNLSNLSIPDLCTLYTHLVNATNAIPVPDTTKPPKKWLKAKQQEKKVLKIILQKEAQRINQHYYD